MFKWLSKLFSNTAGPVRSPTPTEPFRPPSVQTLARPLRGAALAAWRQRMMELASTGDPDALQFFRNDEYLPQPIERYYGDDYGMELNNEQSIRNQEEEVRRVRAEATRDLLTRASLERLVVCIRPDSVCSPTLVAGELARRKYRPDDITDRVLLAVLVQDFDSLRADGDDALRVLRDFHSGRPCYHAVLVKSVAAVARIQQEHALPFLRSLLVSTVSEVQFAAACELARLRQPDGLPQLLADLSDEGLRYLPDLMRDRIEAVGNALGQLRDEESAGRVLSMLGGSDATQLRAALRAAGLRKDARFVAPILPLLKHANTDIRIAAVKALGAIGDNRAEKPLLAELDSATVPLRVEIARSLCAVGWESADANARLKLFAGFGSFEGAERDAEVLRLGLKHADVRVREQAAKVAGRSETGELVPDLSVAMRDPHVGVSSSAADALGRLRTPEAVAALLAALTDPSAVVCGVAAKAVTHHGLAALPDLTPEQRLSLVVQTAGIKSLSPDDPASVPFLIAGLRHHVTKIQRTAAEMLGRTQPGSAQVVEALIAALSMRNPYVREGIINSLGVVGDVRAIAPLEPFLTDKQQNIRQAATAAIAAIRSRTAGA